MTTYVLVAGSRPIGVFDSKQAAVSGYASIHDKMSRYLRWYLYALELNAQPSSDADAVAGEPFAWGYTLITDENGDYIRSQWDGIEHILS